MVVVQVATPLFKVSVPHPVIVVLPTLKLTVPVGIPLPGAVTIIVAVKVTLCPVTDGLKLLESAVEVDALLTTWEIAVAVEVAELTV